MIFLQYDYIRPFYFLVRWQFYEKGRYQLKESELQDAKIFFNAMQRLSDEHKKILSDVYHKSPYPANYDPKRELYMTVKPIRDKELCKEYDMTLDTFRHKRRVAQYYLKLEMQKVLQSIETVFMLRINHKLYLIDYKNENGQYVVGDVSQAKIFQKNDIGEDGLYSLKQTGFLKVPVMSNQRF